MNGHVTTSQPNFDAIARPYRWLEYLTLGRALERCRLHFLPMLTERTRALVFGDGDGRFLASLLARYPVLEVDAVDTSAVMLKLLSQRCHRAPTKAELRLHLHQADALSYLAAPATRRYDLVVTHFFLDCLTESQVEALIAGVLPRLAPDALWLVSDFRLPDGAMRLPAKVLVGSLYLAFRILTGLRTKSLPDHTAALTRAGFTRIACHYSLHGILTTELWSR